MAMHSECYKVIQRHVYILPCQAHPALVKIGPVFAPSFFNNSPLACIHVGVNGLCLVAAWRTGGLLETPPFWHATICYNGTPHSIEMESTISWSLFYIMFCIWDYYDHVLQFLYCWQFVKLLWTDWTSKAWLYYTLNKKLVEFGQIDG